MIITEESTITYTIKPVDGANDNKPFRFTANLSDIEYLGLGHCLIEQTNYWQSMGHDSDHFYVVERNITK